MSKYLRGETKREEKFLDSIRGMWILPEQWTVALDFYREFGSERARAFAITCHTLNFYQDDEKNKEKYKNTMKALNTEWYY